MNITRTLAPLLCSAVLLLGFSAPAEAVTCSSVCSQVQRVCKQQSKHVWSQARYSCGQDEQACTDSCDANAATCPSDCDAASAVCHDSCLSSGDPAACAVDCDSANAACALDCENCNTNCGNAAVVCEEDARTARSDSRGSCATAREDCLAVCVDPIDKVCAKDCITDEHACGATTKRAYGDCKKACDTADARRSCGKACKNDFAAAQEGCSIDTIVCLGGPSPSCINP